MRMKKILLIIGMLPLTALAQTTKEKVLYMDVVRTSGTITTRLESGEDYLGPIYNLETKRLVINGSSRTLSSIKEIRFEIREEEVNHDDDAVLEIGEDATQQPTYDLNGRKVDIQHAMPGVYVKGNRKIIKK